MKPFVHILIVVGILFYVSPVFPDEKAEQFKFLIDGMKFEREKIISGIVRGKGEQIFEREADGKSVIDTGPVEYFIAFDFLEGNQRVDRNESVFKEKGGYYSRLGQYIERKDAIEYCSTPFGNPDLRVIFVANPKEGQYDFRNNDCCHPLDIRLIELLDLQRFTHGGAKPFNVRMDNYTRVPDILVEEENGIFRYEYHQRVEERGELRKSVLWIDVKNGFTHRRSLSIWEFDSRKDNPWILSDKRISWKKIDDVWVPIDIVFENNLPIEEKKKFVMMFDWESVNKPVNQEYFTYCDFEASDHTPVLSVPHKESQGKSDLLGDFINLCGTKEGRLLMKQIEAKDSSRQFRVRLGLISAGIVLIVIGIYLRFRKR
ncbi:hypothetical protein FACS18942_04500 [Planctomycetales bacterium]|nr:hypothetical protein FACS18942_04500 [Planctomycetales bacterium]GHT33942.1 hypothetical protein FACS189427_00400 [Planctomycetales bacterium]